MASYVLLLKEQEDDESVVYRFGPNEDVMGKIELNKITKMFSELESIPDPSIPSKFYFDRAAQRLVVCLVREGGSSQKELHLNHDYPSLQVKGFTSCGGYPVPSEFFIKPVTRIGKRESPMRLKHTLLKLRG